MYVCVCVCVCVFLLQILKNLKFHEGVSFVLLFRILLIHEFETGNCKGDSYNPVTFPCPNATLKILLNLLFLHVCSALLNVLIVPSAAHSATT